MFKKTLNLNRRRIILKNKISLCIIVAAFLFCTSCSNELHNSETTTSLPASESETITTFDIDILYATTAKETEEETLTTTSETTTTTTSETTTTTTSETTTTISDVATTIPPETATPAPKTTTVTSQAARLSGDTIVIITETGTKYHLSGCWTLKKSQIEIRLEDAVDAGYLPCGSCEPGGMVE
jgi:cytoskeletal protein RodZ